MSNAINWYFDFISPFAYLQQAQFPRFPKEIAIHPKPVLLAGLLNHLQHKGPAEIASKRIFSYQYVVWLGRKLGIPLQMPPAHPFNPLRALRLAIALENDLESINRIFNYIWRDGFAIDDDEKWIEFASSLDIDNVDELTNQLDVKQQLHQNTEEAINSGVFGVPSILADGHLFWGFDATDMYLDFQRDPSLYDDMDMRRIETLPASASRNKP